MTGNFITTEAQITSVIDMRNLSSPHFEMLLLTVTPAKLCHINCTGQCCGGLLRSYYQYTRCHVWCQREPPWRHIRPHAPSRCHQHHHIRFLATLLDNIVLPSRTLLARESQSNSVVTNQGQQQDVGGRPPAAAPYLSYVTIEAALSSPPLPGPQWPAYQGQPAPLARPSRASQPL